MLLARLCLITPRQLERIFRKNFHQSPQSWLDQQRMVAARFLLVEKPRVKQVAQELGFSHTSHFDRHFKRYYEITPSQFLQKREQFFELRHQQPWMSPRHF
jgi:AraC-like DNA-binding protein